jgi:outer membrane beta-barrel protein
MVQVSRGGQPGSTSESAKGSSKARGSRWTHLAKQTWFAAILCAGGLFDGAVWAEAPLSGLENELDGLVLPSNLAPAGVSRERLYAVQSRHNPLRGRWGVAAGAAANLSGNSFLISRQVDAELRYHLSDRWSLRLGGAYAFNSLTADSRRLVEAEGVLPDAAYPRNRAQLLGSFNLFYGKFRLRMDRVLYFDQYVAAGPGLVTNQFGTTGAGVAEIGLSFWTGNNVDVRVGLRSFVFRERRLKSESLEQHLLGQLSIGYTWGGSRDRSPALAQAARTNGRDAL